MPAQEPSSCGAAERTRTPNLLIRRSPNGHQRRSDQFTAQVVKGSPVHISPARSEIVRPDGSQDGSRKRAYQCSRELLIFLVMIRSGSPPRTCLVSWTATRQKPGTATVF